MGAVSGGGDLGGETLHLERLLPNSAYMMLDSNKTAEEIDLFNTASRVLNTFADSVRALHPHTSAAARQLGGRGLMWDVRGH